MLDKILDEPLSGWLKSSDPLGKMDSHIVLSSRIRLLVTSKDCILLIGITKSR